MSFYRLIVIFSLCATGCASYQSQVDTTEVEVDAPKPAMQHSLREIVSYDSLRMTRLVDRELNLRESDDDAYLRNATRVLSQTVLIQPNYTEREAALRELKGKLDQEDYILILEKAANDLLYFAKSPIPSDQATAYVGLKNLVLEVRTMHREELKPVLRKIASAQVQISEPAQQYALEPMAKLTSPSVEAQLALQ